MNVFFSTNDRYPYHPPQSGPSYATEFNSWLTILYINFNDIIG